MKLYFKENLVFLRKTLNITQSEIAEQVNKSQRIISNWERDNTEPSLEEIGILSLFLGVSTDDLLFKNLAGAMNSSMPPKKTFEETPTSELTKNIELMETAISALKNTVEDKNAIITLLKSENDRLKTELEKSK